MHPGQRRRLKHDEARRTGGPLVVYRRGRKIATLNYVPTSGWVPTMVDGRELPARTGIEGAEVDAIDRAKADEAAAV